MSKAKVARPIGGKVSDVQQGVISENEFAKDVMIGSGGRVELAAPLTDDERRDFEVHVHGQYGSAVAVQVKSVMQLYQMSKKVRGLRMRFTVEARRLVSDPMFWYFVAYLDPVRMRFAEPIFLVPSTDFHRLASPSLTNGVWHFTMQASMEPTADDKWLPYRVKVADLGKRVMAICQELRTLRAASPSAVHLLELPDIIWARTI